MTTYTIVAFIWYAIIAFGIIMYVTLDGFTLGTGIVMPFINQKERDLAMSVILPTWDGNQTWLVLGAAALYGAFPKAFSTILPLLYFPIYLMVIFLLFRGVTFEFRLKSNLGRKRWDALFIISSIVVTVFQGFILATFVRGFERVSQNGSFLDHNIWFSLFGVIAAVGLLFGYALLGSTRLILKTTGEIQNQMFSLAKKILVLVFVLMVAVSVYTPFVDKSLAKFWFDPQKMTYLAILPIITLILMAYCMWALVKKRDIAPYWCTVGIFLCGYIGFGLSTYPYIVPHTMTFMQAASPLSSLQFILVGAVIMLPILLFYTWYGYRVFKGKVHEVIKY